MIKHITAIFCLLLLVVNLSAQKQKPTPEFKEVNLGQVVLDVTPQPTLKSNNTGNKIDFKKVEDMEGVALKKAQPPFKLIMHPTNDRILKITGNLGTQNWSSIEEQAKEYVRSIVEVKKGNNELEIAITSKNISETGTHLRTIQTFNQLPILGTEGVLHANEEIIHSYSGNLIFNLSVNTTAGISMADAIELAKKSLEKENIEWQEIPVDQYFLLENKERISGGLKILVEEKNQSDLIWSLDMYASMHERWKIYVNAHTGTIVSKQPAFCKLWHHPEHGTCNSKSAEMSIDDKAEIFDKEETTLLPPATATAQDLFNINRTINVFQESGTFYLIDASRPMFNAGLSQFPNDAQGVIWTLDANNTYPQNNDFDYTQITSSNNSWNNKNAVSAHYNGGKAFEYFSQTHNRNSINGQGGNIISLIRVSDENGNDFDNAFWNGAAMFYGNGNQAFNASLAKGLDVAGHEMSHGVIQATANLVYQKQSGALNESFADIFGAMIDRDDWFIGEDIANPSVFPTGRMRDMSDPNNGGNSSNFYWQPKHMNEFKDLPNTQSGDWGACTSILEYQIMHFFFLLQRLESPVPKMFITKF